MTRTLGKEQKVRFGDRESQSPSIGVGRVGGRSKERLYRCLPTVWWPRKQGQEEHFEEPHLVVEDPPPPLGLHRGTRRVTFPQRGSTDRARNFNFLGAVGFLYSCLNCFDQMKKI